MAALLRHLSPAEFDELVAEIGVPHAQYLEITPASFAENQHRIAARLRGAPVPAYLLFLKAVRVFARAHGRRTLSRVVYASNTHHRCLRLEGAALPPSPPGSPPAGAGPPSGEGADLPLSAAPLVAKIQKK